jgi:lipopolysaccharide transport system ATP-binding protein
MNAAIRVEGLSKQYQIGSRQKRDGYRTLREALTATAAATWRGARRLAGAGRPATDEGGAAGDTFFALKDVSFDVQPGEVVGIIGRNGAGKSTLLKILSRIVEPSAGRAVVRGRMGSLLEVGTGFHPELTGRENIYLNGSILGMSRKEIDCKFDEIVAFSEIDKFLDTPVKRYSSGMYVRLAFAVAAHLEPEILIVDEVLAVGDATFQRKCVSRMRDLARSGRTILFVSHNMDLIPRFCGRVVLLDRGRVKAIGASQSIIDRYLTDLAGSSPDGDLRNVHRCGDGRARFTRAWVNSCANGPINAHRTGENLTVHFEINAKEPVDDVALAVNLRTVSGTKIHSAWTKEQNVRVDLAPGDHAFECTFRHVCFRPGFTVEVELWMESGGVLDHVSEALRVPILDGEGTKGYANSLDQGVVLVPATWRLLGPANHTQPTAIC